MTDGTHLIEPGVGVWQGGREIHGEGLHGPDQGRIPQWLGGRCTLWRVGEYTNLMSNAWRGKKQKQNRDNLAVNQEVGGQGANV